MVTVSPFSTMASGPPSAASGEMWPTKHPLLVPENRPSVTTAVFRASPLPYKSFMALYISRIPGPPLGPRSRYRWNRPSTRKCRRWVVPRARAPRAGRRPAPGSPLPRSGSGADREENRPVLDKTRLGKRVSPGAHGDKVLHNRTNTGQRALHQEQGWSGHKNENQQ